MLYPQRSDKYMGEEYVKHPETASLVYDYVHSTSPCMCDYVSTNIKRLLQLEIPFQRTKLTKSYNIKVLNF